MDTTLTDILRTLDLWTPAFITALAGLTLGLTLNIAVRHLRQRRETTLRDLELGISRDHRYLPLWVHALIAAAAATVVAAAVLLPWLLLAVSREGLPTAAIIPGLVGDSILVAIVIAPVATGIIALRRRWNAATRTAAATGNAFLIRSTARLHQPQSEDQ